MATLRIPYAMRGDTVVHVDDVERGLACGAVCPCCGCAMVARKGKQVAHHFAHHKPTECEGESVLHILGKELLQRRIQAAFDAGQPLPLAWRCNICHDDHGGDLLARASSVAVEAPIGDCKPDLLLRRADGKPQAFLEIVTTHAPNATTFEEARKHRVSVFEFPVQDVAALAAFIEAPQLNASSKNRCLLPKCPRCRGHQRPRLLVIREQPCWKCGKPMLMACIQDGVGWFGPARFTPADRDAAIQRGVLLQRHYSSTTRTRYLANTCPHCKTFVGEFHVHDYFLDAAPGEGEHIGFGCERCQD